MIVICSVATKYSKKYLVRVLLNCFKKVFSASTLRGVFQKYLVRVPNTLLTKIKKKFNKNLHLITGNLLCLNLFCLNYFKFCLSLSLLCLI